MSISMALFTLELVALSLTDAQYLLSFFQFMDIIGTVSMAFDISFLLGSKANELLSFGYMFASACSYLDICIIQFYKIFIFEYVFIFKLFPMYSCYIIYYIICYVICYIIVILHCIVL